MSASVLPMRIGLPWARSACGRASEQNGASGRDGPTSVDFHACSSSLSEYIFVLSQCIVNRSNDAKRPKRRGIQSIDTGIRLLEVLEKADGPMALKELSREAPGWIRAARTATWRASCAAAWWCRAPTRATTSARSRCASAWPPSSGCDPVQAAERALPDLVAETGLTALLAVWSNRGPTIVHWQRTGNFVTSLNLGRCCR